MSDAVAETLSVVVERDIAFPPEKVWRALTQPHLIAEWLMKNDFAPMAGHRFRFTADWGSVDCQVLEVEPNRTLSYSWGAFGVGTVVTWSLTPTGAGTRLRMEQSGFPKTLRQAWRGAQVGWPGFFSKLEQVLAGVD
jgi:uncharacterized protein YndB with AHSA1/START domain